ncbi:MAG: hypothetical protein ACYCQJ_11410 [Nitrososphaerales archaeon]
MGNRSESNSKHVANRGHSRRIPNEAVFPEKHTLRMASIFSQTDSQARLYPSGLVSLLEEDSNSDLKQVRRIELVGKNRRSNEIYGVLRNIFVAFSSERGLLDLANYSDNIVSVRAVSGNEKSPSIIEDKLVIKRIEKNPEGQKQPNPFASVLRTIPARSIKVSSHWLDRMNLSSGDRVIVSNPVENFVRPPPELAGV